MSQIKLNVLCTLGCIFLLPVSALSQGRGGSDWSANGGDAQRSSWVRTDPKISAESMRAPGFKFMWKVKFPNDGGSLSAPVLQDRYIGYRGFRTYAFVGGSADHVFALDSDLARIEWQKRFPLSAKAGAGACPGGMTASVTRGVSAAPPQAAVGGGGRGRGGPAKSGVGAAGEGAVTLSQIAAAPARGPAPAFGPGGPGRGRTPVYLHAISSDGALHNMYVSNGEEPEPPIKFLPANANASGLIVVDNIAYAATTGNCGGVPDGIWALDPATKNVASWKGSLAGATSPAFGADGTVYIATASGDILALEPKTLNKKASYTAGQAFASSPVVFEYKEKSYVAASAKDGSIHVLEAASLTKAGSITAPGAVALAAFQDSIVATTPTGISVWTMADQGGVLSFRPAWTSMEINSPTAPAIVNGVMFTAASGSASSHATLYALDAATGKEVWSSGNTITSYIPPNGGLSAGGSSIYLGTRDGTFWAFGFPIEH